MFYVHIRLVATLSQLPMKQILTVYLLYPTYMPKNWVSRQTVVSHEAKKNQHTSAFSGLRDHYSELFTWMEALKADIA